MIYILVFMMVTCGFNITFNAASQSKKRVCFKSLEKDKKTDDLSDVARSFLQKHPCGGVCACGCYVDHNDMVERIFDIGCKPLNGVRHDQEDSIYFACHYAGNNNLLEEFTQKFYSSLIIAFFFKGRGYCAATCCAIPLIADDGSEQLEASCFKQVSFGFQSETHDRRFIMQNPCQKVMK